VWLMHEIYDTFSLELRIQLLEWNRPVEFVEMNRIKEIRNSCECSH
jgi:hypothetical protein